jgi:hypothetical protein
MIERNTPARASNALSFMQRRLAAATPSKWRDAIVAEVTARGDVRLALVDDGLELVVRQHSGYAGAIRAGDPVAVHPVYNVLAIGQNWFALLEVAA